jgi:hypothetical protein
MLRTAADRILASSADFEPVDPLTSSFTLGLRDSSRKPARGT